MLLLLLGVPAVPDYIVFLHAVRGLLFLGVSVIPWYSCCFLGVPSVPAVLGCSLVLLLFGMHGYGNPAYSSRLGNVTKLTAETPRNSSNTEE